MSLDLTLLSKVGRMPLTGVPGADVDFYSQTKLSKDLFTKTGCDFTSTQSKFGTSSMQFSGQASKLTVKTPFIIGETSVAAVSTYNFTISCWVRPSRVDLAWQGIFAESTSHAVFLNNNRFVYYGSSANLIISPVVTADQWYHLALCKSGSTINFYINGVAASAGITRNVVFPISYIGGSSAVGEGLSGFINDFKYENVALYSGNFTPPTEAINLDLFEFPTKLIRNTNKVSGFVYQSLTAKKSAAPSLIQKTYHLGPGRILGTVKESHLPSDLPLSRRVRLYRKADGLLIDETWSDAAGNYAFLNLAIQKYYVIAFDHTNTYNAVVKDSITPEI